MNVEEAVRNANKEWVSSINAGDVEDLLQRVADGVSFMPPGEPAVVGRAAFSEYVQGMFGQVSVKVEILSENVVAGEGVGCLFGTATIEATPLGSEGTMVESVKWAHVFELYRDGTWKMAVNIWNSEHQAEGH